MEETNLKRKEIQTLGKLTPLIENLTGTNGVPYRHIYYPGFTEKDFKLVLDENNKNQFYEIGDIKWMTSNQAHNIFREHHYNRKKILNQLFWFIMYELEDYISQ